ncbi:hypothetical protein QBC34DRAFT_55929 [Podospora aff. communis PSN243]|uniref:Uncharacterized protein n=1 Tax=Podospora aff. communis PSN243 TaxID=3040156 RepID=A0AAV9GUT8_9PEZI|nr:hypothetical protein QBC34DRAFT_55929 [Podospora aff. communis PSN243]
MCLRVMGWRRRKREPACVATHRARDLKQYSNSPSEPSLGERLPRFLTRGAPTCVWKSTLQRNQSTSDVCILPSNQTEIWRQASRGPLLVVRPRSPGHDETKRQSERERRRRVGDAHAAACSDVSVSKTSWNNSKHAASGSVMALFLAAIQSVQPLVAQSISFRLPRAVGRMLGMSYPTCRPRGALVLVWGAEALLLGLLACCLLDSGRTGY